MKKDHAIRFKKELGIKQNAKEKIRWIKFNTIPEQLIFFYL